MNLKTTKKIATENFQTYAPDDHTLELLGNDILMESRGPLHTFKELFGFNSFFHYYAEHGCQKFNKKDGEAGIGFLTRKNDKILLIRKKILIITYEGIPINVPKGRYCTFPIVDPDDCLIVTSIIPNDISSFFPNKNSVLCASEEFAPNSFQLDNNSLLVCFDNQLQSMTFKEFARHLHEYS